MNEFENVPVIELDNQNKTPRKRYLGTVIAAVSSALLTASVIYAKENNNSEFEKKFITPAEALSIDVLPVDTTTTVIDPLNPTPVDGGNAVNPIDVLPVDTTTTVIDPLNPTPVDGGNAVNPIDVLPVDTTTTVIDPLNPISNQPDTTLAPTTTLPPELGVEFSIFDNDQDNITSLGQFVLYTIQISNNDNWAKSFNLSTGFFDDNSLGYLYNINYQGCGAPSLVDNRRNFQINNLTLDANSNCSITFEADVIYTGGSMQAFSQINPLSGTTRNYYDNSDILYSQL